MVGILIDWREEVIGKEELKDTGREHWWIKDLTHQKLKWLNKQTALEHSRQAAGSLLPQNGSWNTTAPRKTMLKEKCHWDITETGFLSSY